MGPASIMASLHNNISPKNAFPVSWEDVTCTDVENVVVHWEADVGRKGRRPQFIGFLRHSIHSLSRFPPPCALLTISSRQGQSHLIDLKFFRFFKNNLGFLFAGFIRDFCWTSCAFLLLLRSAMSVPLIPTLAIRSRLGQSLVD